MSLTKAIQSVTKNQDSFSKSVTKLSQLLEETLSDLETKLSQKNKEIEELSLKYQQEEKNRKIEVDQQIKEYGYESVKSLLAERKEISVREDEYKKLMDDFTQLKASKEKEIKDTILHERKKNEQYNENLKKTLELQKQAEVAQVQARLETQTQHIEVLKSTIKDLKSDLDEQRKLTKDVAQASVKQMPMFYPQQQK